MQSSAGDDESMRDYYVTRSGRIRRSENSIELELTDGSKRLVPINDVKSIHLFGELDLNTKLLVFLGQKGIPLHVYNWYGNYTGTFYPREKVVSGFLLVKQVEYYLDKENRLFIAKEFVGTAIHNIIQNLKHFQENGKDVKSIIEAIQKEETSLGLQQTIPDVMGVEGRVHELYYTSFGRVLRNGFEFETRTRQPPENMLNCLISFGNSLMYATVVSEIYRTQLSPLVSYLHEPGERRYSLALDLAEVFKPVVVDRVIFNLINNRLISEKDFVKELNSCYLNDSGRRTFIQEYDKKLNTTLRHKRLKRHVSYRELIRIEVYKLVKHLLDEDQYRGFRAP